MEPQRTDPKDFLQDSGGYVPDSAESGSTDADTYDTMQVLYREGGREGEEGGEGRGEGERLTRGFERREGGREGSREFGRRRREREGGREGGREGKRSCIGKCVIVPLIQQGYMACRQDQGGCC